MYLVHVTLIGKRLQQNNSWIYSSGTCSTRDTCGFKFRVSLLQCRLLNTSREFGLPCWWEKTSILTFLSQWCLFDRKCNGFDPKSKIAPWFLVLNISFTKINVCFKINNCRQNCLKKYTNFYLNNLLLDSAK